MMDEAVISAKLRRSVGAEINLRAEGIDKFYVSTPFRYEDGDHIELYLKTAKGRLVLTDDGLTLMKLSYDVPEYDSSARNKIIERVLITENVSNDEGALVLETTEEELGSACLSLIEAILKISDVAYLKKEVVRSVFFEEFKIFIEQRITNRQVRFRHNFPDTDPHGTYPIDCVIQNGGLPLFSFAVTSDSNCRDATITIMHYEKVMEFHSMVVFEEQESIGRNALARLTDVCQRQFSNLSGNRDRIVEHILKSTS